MIVVSELLKKVPYQKLNFKPHKGYSLRHSGFPLPDKSGGNQGLCGDKKSFFRCVLCERKRRWRRGGWPAKKKTPKIFPGLKWRLPELNWGHTDFQSVALPTELKRHPTNETKYKNFYFISQENFIQFSILFYHICHLQRKAW